MQDAIGRCDSELCPMTADSKPQGRNVPKRATSPMTTFRPTAGFQQRPHTHTPVAILRNGVPISVSTPGDAARRSALRVGIVSPIWASSPRLSHAPRGVRRPTVGVAHSTHPTPNGIPPSFAGRDPPVASLLRLTTQATGKAARHLPHSAHPDHTRGAARQMRVQPTRVTRETEVHAKRRRPAPQGCQARLPQ